MVNEVPKVSVVMSVFSGERYLKDAVESILSQTFHDFEFIIINDGSTDSTPQILQGYAQADKRIRIVNQANMGLTKSLNRGISLARGKWIARQDADDISMSSRLEKQLEFLASHPEVGVLGTAVKVISSKGKIIRIVRSELEDGDIQFYLLRDNPLAHGSVMFSMDIFERIGGYDEAIRYGQDYDLWWRMSRYTRLANLPEPLYYLRKHDSSVSRLQRYEQALIGDQISVRNCLDTIREILGEFKEGGRGREFADVSAIICTRNGYSDVVRCICHVLKQDVVPREIVIVDGITESGVEKLVAETFDVALPVIRYIHSKAGLALQRNVGIRSSAGSIILFLDDDIVVYPGFVGNILRVFNEAPEPIGGITGNIINAHRDEKSYLALLSRIFFSYGFGDGSFKRSGAATYPYGLPDVREVEFLGCGQVAYRREVCEEFWFDESISEGDSHHLVDVEFSYRVSRKYKNYYTPYTRSFRNNETRLKEYQPKVDLSMKLTNTNHKYHFRKNVPKNLLNWLAFGLSACYIGHQQKFEDTLEFLSALKQRLQSAMGLRAYGDPS